ncbi:unnamed protein product [Moneuplotes crassus]|uniref:Uncharacterized protein n=2 Tax=Euplotes crassus TaxID=5936 RepID=A0AAD2D8P5_EUPCR|nr:unnamed protein product [Moneuplotes crassus]CAI2383498.1 unnamed protein product [Moneuplotes crassus]
MSSSKIQEGHKKYFREIFNLQANDDRKIDYNGLLEIFSMVDFHPNEKQHEEFKQLFEHKEFIDFNEFLKIFTLKSNDYYTKTDVMNAFRLLSKEYEKPGYIKVDRVWEILKEMGLKEIEIVHLTTQLQDLEKEDGMFNFEDFVNDSF